MNSQSAKNGFRTFILTLSVSLIVFSLIYYAISNTSDSSKKSLEFSSADKETAYVVETVAGVSDDQEESVFADIKENSNQGGYVLALTDESEPEDPVQVQSTESAQTPDTGVFSITVGLSLSLIMFVLGLFVISKNPRNLALTSFERKFRDFD